MNKIYEQNESCNKKRTKQKQKYWMCSNHYKKARNTYKNKAIAMGLHQYAIPNGYKGFLLTATAETAKTPLTTRQELAEKFTKIRQTLRRNHIENFGYKSFEKHENGLYHLHIMIYVAADSKDAFKEIYKRYFKNHVNVNEQAIQEITETPEYIDDYLIWFSIENDDEEETTKISEKSDISFFGLRKGTMSKWQYVYKTAKANLTPEEWQAKRCMVNKAYGKALVILDAFNLENITPEAEKLITKKEKKTTNNKKKRLNERKSNITIPRMCKYVLDYFHGPPDMKIIINFVEKRQYISNYRRKPMNRLHSKRERYEKKREELQRATGPPENNVNYGDNSTS